MKRKILFFLFSLLFLQLFSQSKFQFYGKKDRKLRVKFELINNLIVLPLEINGKQLSFILDTGVNKTILFNLSREDNIELKNVERVTLKGLGSEAPVDAYISKHNTFKVGNLISRSEDLYIILRDEFDISAKMGTTIHGIIGYDLLKDVVTEINYANETITFYNSKKYKERKCKKCEVFPIQFYRNKPYIDLISQIDTLSNKKISVKMLIDSGGSDALWLFENTKPEIVTPKKYFKDIIGEGLNGVIYGNRSKIPSINLGNFHINRPTVSFLDSLSTHHARKFSDRNGSIGGALLRRFKIIVDYPNKKVTFKKNGSLKRGFYYNMSGLHIAYNGQELVKELMPTKVVNEYNNSGDESSNRKTISMITSYRFVFKPNYKIYNVVKGSPADKAGLLEDDIIKKVNGKPVYAYKLSEINALFQKEPNKKIRIEIERLGVRFKYQFVLKERI